MLLGLECRGFRGKRFPFRVELLTHALEHFVNDATNAYRIYELFSIERPRAMVDNALLHAGPV